MWTPRSKNQQNQIKVIKDYKPKQTKIQKIVKTTMKFQEYKQRLSEWVNDLSE